LTGFLWLLLGCVVLAIIAVLARRHSFRRIPDLDDREFARVYKDTFEGEDVAIIREREFIARVFGVSPRKLHPNQQFKDLSNLSFDVGFEVAMGDLEYALIDLRKRARSNTGSHFPDTVGELVSVLVSLRNTIEDET
jgi:hypothetical protein